jgi:hypothetical protein
MKTTDQRGFTAFDEFKCTRNTNIRIKESSAASDPHIWLFLDEDATVFTRPTPGSAGAHLSIENAERLRDALDVAIREHYQIAAGAPE